MVVAKKHLSQMSRTCLSALSSSQAYSMRRSRLSIHFHILRVSFEIFAQAPVLVFFFGWGSNPTSDSKNDSRLKTLNHQSFSCTYVSTKRLEISLKERDPPHPLSPCPKPYRRGYISDPFSASIIQTRMHTPSL